jgi:hypothetical protein
MELPLFAVHLTPAGWIVCGPVADPCLPAVVAVAVVRQAEPVLNQLSIPILAAPRARRQGAQPSPRRARVVGNARIIHQAVAQSGAAITELS